MKMEREIVEDVYCGDSQEEILGQIKDMTQSPLFKLLKNFLKFGLTFNIHTFV
jgi:hypothetical protein